MRKRLLAFLIIAPLLMAALYAADQQAAKPQAPPAKPAVAAPAAAPAQGPRPEQFLGKFPPLDFKPPKAADFRTTLSNGLVVYIAEDHEIPWFEATLLTPVAGGGGGGGRGRGMDDGGGLLPAAPGGGGGGGARSFLEPKDKLGLQAICGSVMRSGGTTTMTADQINERMEFLAGSVSPTSAVDPHALRGRGAQDLARHPQQPGVPRGPDQAREATRWRRRSATATATSPAWPAPWERLMYGEDSPITAEVDRGDHQQHHARRRRGVAQEVLGLQQRHPRRDRRLQEGRDAGEARGHVRQVARRRGQGDAAVAEGHGQSQPSPASTWCSRSGATPNQGIIRDRHAQPDAGRPRLPGRRPDELHAGRRVVLVAHHPGGAHRPGAGLHRQLVSVRADLHYPGAFAGFTQTKNSTVVFAAQLIMNEIERMYSGDVTEKDLQFAKSARLNAFPSMFSTVTGTSRNFARSNSRAGRATTTRPTWTRTRR